MYNKLRDKKPKNICVFCSGRDEVDQKYKDLAEKLGKMIAENGHSLVYGGNAGGMMGILANSTQKAGGKVIGVFPKSLRGMEEINENADEMIFVDHISHRKQEMVNRSDIFVVLPGGFGTLDEFFEVVTLKNIMDPSMRDKPIIIVNYDNYWELLVQLLQSFYVNNFAIASRRDGRNYIVFNNIDEKLFDLYYLS